MFASVAGLNTTEAALSPEIQTNGSIGTKALAPDQKESRRIAGRVLRAVKPLLAEAARKEVELGGKPFEKELQELDNLLNNSMLMRRNSLAASLNDDGSEDGMAMKDILSNGNGNIEKPKIADDINDTEMKDALQETAIDVHDEDAPGEDIDDDPYFLTLSTEGTRVVGDPTSKALAEENQLAQDLNNQLNPPLLKDEANPGNQGPHTGLNGVAGSATEHGSYGESGHSVQQPTPPTPPSSGEDESTAYLSGGGIPWYIKPFDPVGTTIHEERWTGREVLRAMSEELSEIDDDELRGLVDNDLDEEVVEGNQQTGAGSAVAAPRKKAGKKAKGSRRSRNYR